ncbi:MAG TPA: NrdJb [Nitrococcus sp.]|nr:NrdJb [Nitrococcus sp.]
MAIKIDSKIIDYEVAKADAERAKGPGSEIEQMHEKLQRPETLEGRTYKIKTPLSEHALYVTINDVVLNPGTPHEVRRPFEIFINSKNMDHFQWIVALTRIISAVFRKGGDCTFLVEELRSVFDPRGGYFKRGGRFMPSLVAEIGDVIERHLKSIGLLDESTLDARQQAYVQARRAEYDSRQAPVSQVAADCEDSANGSPYPESAVLCPRCHTKAMIQMEGCLTCLSCGESKCS